MGTLSRLMGGVDDPAVLYVLCGGTRPSEGGVWYPSSALIACRSSEAERLCEMVAGGSAAAGAAPGEANLGPGDSDLSLCPLR